MRIINILLLILLFPGCAALSNTNDHERFNRKVETFYYACIRYTTYLPNQCRALTDSYREDLIGQSKAQQHYEATGQYYGPVN